MNTPEMSKGPTPQSVDRLEAISSLLFDVSTLISEIKSEPQETMTVYPFPLLDGHHVELPSAVLRQMPDVDTVLVIVKHGEPRNDGTTEPSYLSFDFLSRDQQLSVSRDGQLQETELDTADSLLELKDVTAYEDEATFKARIRQIETIPQPELNALLFSLMYPNPERAYALVHNVDFHEPNIIDALNDSLRASAYQTHSSSEYEFKSHQLASIQYGEHDGSTAHFSFMFADPITRRTVFAQTDMQKSFELKFFTLEDGVKTNFYPTADEIHAISSLVKAELDVLNRSIPTEAAHGYGHEDTPEKTVIDNGSPIYSAKHTQNILDKLDFDTPDTSA
jgi:hypothetical protein